MKKLLLFVLVLIGCNNDYHVVDISVVKGIVSAKEEGHRGRAVTLPKIYVQNSKKTIPIDIPFANENDYKVGDSIIVIIQQIEKLK